MSTAAPAVVCRRYGPPEDLQVESWPVPPPAPGELAVRVQAVGLNLPDVLLVKGLYQERPPLPFVPGGELAGTVVALGEGVTAWQPGDAVMALTLRGALAQQVNVPVRLARRVPAGMPIAVAAGFQGVYNTAHYALSRRGLLRAGETLLVLGAAGGVGLAAVQLGHAAGARVIAAASSPAKLDVARASGADELVDYSSESLRDRLKELTGGRGVDVAFDPVGGAAFDAATRCMAWNGRYLVIGFAAGRIGSLAANLPLLKGYSLVGVYYGRFREEEPAAARAVADELEQLYAAGAIAPRIDRSFPLADITAACHYLEQALPRGKVIIEM